MEQHTVAEPQLQNQVESPVSICKYTILWDLTFTRVIRKEEVLDVVDIIALYF